MALRQSMNGTRQHQRNVEDAIGWTERDRAGAVGRSPTSVADGPQPARAGRHRLGRPDLAQRDRRRARAAHRGASRRDASTTYRGSYIFSGAETAVPPVRPPAPTTRTRATTPGPDPACPGIVREIGPGVTMTINVVGREVLGEGQGAGDGKLLDVMRDAVDHLRAGDGAAVAAPTSTRLDANFDNLLDVRAGNGATRQPARGSALAARRGRGDHAQSALGDRGRRHRQDHHRPELPAGRLPGRPARGGEHRPVLPHGLPALIQRHAPSVPSEPRSQTTMSIVTVESSRFGTLEIEAGAIIEFPTGLIGLGGRRWAVVVDRPHWPVPVAALARRPARSPCP